MGVPDIHSVFPWLRGAAKVARHALTDRADDVVTQANIFPETPTVTKEQWEKIVRYYVQNAPEQLSDSSDNYPISPTLTRFKPVQNFPAVEPFVSLIKFESVAQQFFIGTRLGKIHVFDKETEQAYF